LIPGSFIPIWDAYVLALGKNADDRIFKRKIIPPVLIEGNANLDLEEKIVAPQQILAQDPGKVKSGDTKTVEHCGKIINITFNF